MTHRYDTIEPTVIDEELLTETVKEQGPKEQAGILGETEETDFRDVEALQLDFKNILKIDGLFQFTNLTKLQLDNNIIEKIENLEMLVNLVWLDLSFNNIEAIEGLDTLTKLEDLSLFNNHIRRIENIDTLNNLEILSIGNNNLGDLEDLVYLRRFPRLKTLNLSTNPISDLHIYKHYVAAILPHLVYLDYRLLEDEDRQEGYNKFQILVEQILDGEKKEAAVQEKHVKQTEDYDYYCKAYVEDLNGSYLFAVMYSNDKEGLALLELPGAKEQYLKYKEDFSKICMDLFEYGLREYEKRTEDEKIFWECLEQAKEDNAELSRKIVNNFLAEKTARFAEIGRMKDKRQLHRAVNDFNMRVTVLWDKLMGNEVTLLDQLEEMIQFFDLNMQDMVNSFTETAQGYISQLRELETFNHEKMLSIASENIDIVLKGELDISEELEAIFIDKDSVAGAVCISHDAHLLKIDIKEDKILSGVKRWAKGLLDNINEEHYHARSRKRIQEIVNLVDNFRFELENLELGEYPKL